MDEFVTEAIAQAKYGLEAREILCGWVLIVFDRILIRGNHRRMSDGDPITYIKEIESWRKTSHRHHYQGKMGIFNLNVLLLKYRCCGTVLNSESRYRRICNFS